MGGRSQCQRIEGPGSLTLRSSRGGTWGPLLLAIYGVGLLGAGIFVADPAAGFPPGTPVEAGVSRNGILHFVFGGIGFYGLIAACFVFARRFARLGRRGWAAYSVISGLGFFAAFSAIQSGSGRPAVMLAFYAAVAWIWIWHADLSWKLRREAKTPTGSSFGHTLATFGDRPGRRRPGAGPPEPGPGYAFAGVTMKGARMKTSQASNLTADDYISIQGIAEHRWPQAMLERDWDAALAMCTPDVVYMPVDQPRLEGQAALRKWLNEFPALVEFSQPLESVDGMNHLAVALGRFTVKLEGSGQHINGTGKVMCCLEKASSGQWLVKAVCWNWDQPMPPAI